MMDQLHLGVFLYGNCNYHIGGWRDPNSYTDMGSNLGPWVILARKMEAAKLDMLFIADAPGVTGSDNPALLSRTGRVEALEPLTMLGALSTVTERLGLVATCATAYSQPFTVARAFASLDQLSRGRIGWNLVTGGVAEDAQNFNLRSHVAHLDRYAQAEEFADVVIGLWDSIDNDAFLRDKAAGEYLKRGSVHQLNHVGEYYSVRGPLGVGRSPQGRPVLIQAGKSEQGRALSARVADVVFTSQATLKEGQEFYSDLKARATGFGRSADQIKIMPGIAVYVGSSLAEAEDKYERLNALTPIEVALRQLKTLLGGTDLSVYDLDAPAPQFESNTARMSSGPSYARLARDQDMTLRELALRSSAGKDHLTVKGTASMVADVMEDWFRSGAADGFNLLPPTVPGGLDDFLTQVVPELQQRGIFRREYSGTTLRDHFGLAAPSSRYAPSSAGRHANRQAF